MDALGARLAHGVSTRGAALMGVLNVTPDSFFDGGRYQGLEQSLDRVDQLMAQGADILDIGGESSRPGSAAVPASEQLRRIEPALRYALERGAIVSVDTTDPHVATAALEAGAHAINDVSCLANPELARVCAEFRATLILMHSRGPMSQMRNFSEFPDAAYGADVVDAVLAEWREARDRAVALGLRHKDVWLDPGLGFAKNARHSFAILRELSRFAEEGVPVVLGASRKSFIGSLDGSPPERRLAGSIAAALLGVQRGARVLRVHDVADVNQALLVARNARSPSHGELPCWS